MTVEPDARTIRKITEKTIELAETPSTVLAIVAAALKTKPTPSALVTEIFLSERPKTIDTLLRLHDESPFDAMADAAALFESEDGKNAWAVLKTFGAVTGNPSPKAILAGKNLAETVVGLDEKQLAILSSANDLLKR